MLHGDLFTFHSQLGGACVVSDLHAVGAFVLQRHLLDDQFAVAAFAADLEAFGGQDDVDASVPADAAPGVGHGAVQDDAALLQGAGVLQRFHDVHRELWSTNSVKSKKKGCSILFMMF